MERHEIKKELEKYFDEESKKVYARAEELDRTSKNLLDNKIHFLPKMSDVSLKNLDILLDISKTLFIIFTTIFTTALALNVEQIGNVDVNKIQAISLFTVGISIFALIIISTIRSLTVSKILDYYQEISDLYEELISLEYSRKEFVSPENKEKIIKEIIKNNQERK